MLVEVESALRLERQQVWDGLVWVLAHEINNSLTPIKSIAKTLLDTVRQERQLPAHELRDPLQRIAHRSTSLIRFIQGYANIARLPRPSIEIVRVDCIIHHCIGMLDGVSVVTGGGELTLKADPAMLEQALINLLNNAVDSTRECQHPEISIDWRYQTRYQRPGLALCITDNGSGLNAPENLFKPFYSTKPGGSGIGLLLARRIAELHHGELLLRNREDSRAGAVAELWLPLAAGGE